MSTNANARGPEAVRRDIEHTREELAETAAALAERADVKARAHEKLDATKARLAHRAHDAKAKVTDTAGAATPSAVADRAQHVAARVGARVRENPVPTAAIAGFAGGLLVAWLAARRS